MKLCIKCGNKIPNKSKSIKYCSPVCSKLYLKSQYKKRNRKKINAYNREYRKRGIRGNPSTNGIIGGFFRRNQRCARCGKRIVNVCHIKPRWAGGKNKDNLISLCNRCHYRFDNLLRDFWKTE